MSMIKTHRWDMKAERCINCGMSLEHFEDSPTMIPCVPIKSGMERAINNKFDEYAEKRIRLLREDMRHDDR